MAAWFRASFSLAIDRTADDGGDCDTFKERIQHVQGLSDSDGHMFSPIELDITTMLPLDLPQLDWYNYDLMPKKMKITNTTHTGDFSTSALFMKTMTP
ncbi:unnamed protein product [Timema podura]|uniref:Uncharacterized protein n=1 Tax=Timema podura TaxID=61482 RepID=A0ABN7PJC6_TIMPD|nr:unnamed protein product [Timema podura]